MDEKYYQPIVTLEKIEELLTAFREYSPKLYSKYDEGFDWIEEDNSRCMVLANPFCDENIDILIDLGEFVVFFAGYHCHCFAYQGDFEDMIQTVKCILHNELCAAVLWDSADKWFGSRLLEKTEIDKSPTEMFDTTFESKEFSDHLAESGYRIKLTFWNPVDSKTIEVQKKSMVNN